MDILSTTLLILVLILSFFLIDTLRDNKRKGESLKEQLLTFKSFVKEKDDYVEHKVRLGYKTWTEDFVDEDNGEVVSIDRRELVSVNGIYTNSNGQRFTKCDSQILLTVHKDRVWKESKETESSRWK